MARGYLRPSESKRVARVVRRDEYGNRSQPPIKFRTVSDDSERLRLCKTTALWEVGTVATLEVWEEGETPDEEPSGGSGGETIDATNHLWDVDEDTFCLVMYGGAGANYLVNAFPAASTCEGEGS